LRRIAPTEVEDNAEEAEMIVDCAHYRDGRRQHEGSMDLDQAAQISRAESADGFVWIGMLDPDADELAELQARFDLHDLAVEDAQTFHLRPKVEQYDEGRIFFVVLRTARYVAELDEVEFGEISIFASGRFLITVRQGPASDLHEARLRLERRPELLRTGPLAAFWAIVDKVVDDYAPVVEGLEQDVEQVEATVFSGSAAATEQIYKLRREVSDFYRAVHPLLAPLEAIERGAFPQVTERLIPFFRDVNDHLKLVNEEVAGQRELLAVILQANMAVISLEQNEISVRQNETMKQLTVIATIFLPLAFITGFFGMNFAWMTTRIESFWTFAVLGIGSLLASCVLLWAWFRRGGLIDAG
jgi:magnesium transporter